MSWGYRITFLTLGFVAFMTFLVISAFHQNFDLVAEDYYGRELKFQTQIEKQQNQLDLKDTIMCAISGQHIIVKFPDQLVGQKIEGKVVFFRPSDAGKDIEMPLALNRNGIQIIGKHNFSRGLYHAQFDYQAGGKSYYSDKTIMIR